MAWHTYHLLQNDIILLLYCQVDSYPNENLWKMFKDPKRSFSGPLKLLMSLSKIYEKSLKIFFRTFEALEDHVTDLRKSLKIFFRNFEALDNLVKDLWKSLKIFFRTFQALEDLVKDKKPWRYLKFLLRSLEIFHFHAKILNSSGGNNRSHYCL